MKKISVLAFLLSSIFFVSCNSTKITSSWRDPDVHVHINQLNKVLVVALLKNETNRHKAEDEMVKYLNGKGIVSYNYLDENFNKKDETELRKKIKSDGFDGAITMRLIDVDKEKVYVPGERNLYPDYYNNFNSYYHRNIEFYTTPGYYVVTKTFLVETVVYSIADDKIIWSGITKTFNPEGAEKMSSEITKTIYKKMTAEGFIKKE